jgi:hypothetical protein
VLEGIAGVEYVREWFYYSLADQLLITPNEALRTKDDSLMSRKPQRKLLCVLLLLMHWSGLTMEP